MNTLDILERLVAFDTVSTKSNIALMDYVEDYLKSRGFRVVLLPDGSGEKAGLFAVLGDEACDGILLSGHTDVVSVDGQAWTKNPFKLTEENGRLYGRGTTDMKGYVASVLALADKAARVDLKEPLKIVLSYDEEIGCVGIRHMLDDVSSMIGTPRVCIVGEPTEMCVAIGHKGKAALRATCFGQSGHSALAPNFVNAIHVACGFVLELQDLQRYLMAYGVRDEAYGVPYSTIHVGQFAGGTALNIVPDRVDLVFEYRHLVGDPIEWLEDLIRQAADKAVEPYRSLTSAARIGFERYNYYPGFDVCAEDDVVYLGRGLAQSGCVVKVAFGTEAGYFDGLGIPTIVCGPGSMEGQGHKPDEFISKEALSHCDAMMMRILNEISDRYID